MLFFAMLLDELFEDLSTVGMGFGHFQKTGHDSVLENLISSVADKHDQLDT
jgi:hypothetical protein